MLYLVFVFGLIVGSFLNVVIYRLNPALQLKSGVFGRSMCLNCKTKLNWYDLVPVFSFIWLRGACRYCQKKISWQYPIVELLSGALWAGVFYKFALPAEALAKAGVLDVFYYIFIFSALLVIAVYDFKWQIIPDKIVYPAIIAVFIYNFFESLNFEIFKLLNIGYLNLEIFKYLNFETFTYSLFIAFIAFLFFFSVFYFSSGKAMGLGDAKLGFLIGLFLSPLAAGIAFTLSFIIGAAFGILLIVFKKKSWKSQIAFGPFLVLGAFIAFFFSDFIVRYLNFLKF